MTCARYAREVERRWRELQGAPAVLSPKDWTVLREWYELGVPLALIDESIEVLHEGRRRRLPRSLAQIDRAVRAGWATVRAGRPERSADPRRDGPPPALERWRRVRDEQTACASLRSLIARLADRVAAGEDAAAVDLELDRELPAACPPTLVADVTREVERELAPFRDRIEGEALDASRRRALARRLRLRLGLPRLSG